MTEAEWLACASPGTMLQYLCDRRGAARRKNGRRKLRLLACACCRRVWHKLTEERDRHIVLVAEDLADGLASAEEVDSARRRCLDRTEYIFPAIRVAIATTAPQPRAAVQEVLFGVCAAVASHGVGYPERWKAEGKALAGVMREVFGNPFRVPAVKRAWLSWNDGAVRRLAQHVYDERAFDHLPVLADALEDAGCADGDILGHCRSGGEHVRGCWAVDLILGKG
jgi:hypothetical protein